MASFNRKFVFAAAFVFAGTLSALAQVNNPGTPTSGAPANNDCAKFVVSGGSVQSITTAGAACGAGSGGTPGGVSGNVQTNNGAGGFGGLTNAQLTALINPATSALAGAVPAWPNNTTTFFRGDGSYSVLPPVSATVPGIVPAFPNVTTSFFRGDGTYAGIPFSALTGSATVAQLPAVSAVSAGIVPLFPNNATTFFRGDGTYATLNCAALAGVAASCGTDATNASNIGSGTLAAARLPVGVPANVLNAQVANYPIATTDCGKTVQAGTGSTGFFTITLPAAAGFSGVPTCVVTVTNNDTLRAKGLSGFPANLPPFLFALQTLRVELINGAWVATLVPGLWTPTAQITFIYDNVNGSDANDCLAAGAGNACLTGNRAVALLANYVNNINNVVIQASPGSTYTAQVSAISYTGPGSVTFDGNSSTISPSSATGGCIFCVGTPNAQGVAGIWQFRRWTISNAASGIYGIVCTNSRCTTQDGLTIGTLTAGSALACSQSANCVVQNPITVTGTALLHLFDESDNSVIKSRNLTHVFTTAGLTLSGALISAHGGGLIDIVGDAWTITNPNTVSGARYLADLFGLIDSGACATIGGTSSGYSAGTPTAGTIGTTGGFCN